MRLPATTPVPGGASLRVACGCRSKSAALVVCQMPEKSGLPFNLGILSAAVAVPACNVAASRRVAKTVRAWVAGFMAGVSFTSVRRLAAEKDLIGA